jgi:hypothetical protein
VIRVAAVLAIAVVLGGCSPTVDSFSIHRYWTDVGNHWDFPPLDRTVNDPAIASQVYNDVRALRPNAERGTVFCAIDFGVRHELSFFSRGTRVLHAVMEMGCGTVDLGAGDVRAIDGRFEADLLGALGLYTRGNGLWPSPIPRP